MWIERNGEKMEYNGTENDFNNTSLPLKGWNISEPPTPYQPTQQEIIDGLTNAVQLYLDIKARERNYDGILSACTYATSTVPKFRAEGQACVEWRDSVWAKCYEVLNDCLAETREIPTSEQLVSELPVFIWPEEV